MNYSRGFTLIELMIVIAIIGILASVATAQFTTYQKRAKFSDVIVETINYKQAAELAFQTDEITLDDLDAGYLGIPARVDVMGTRKPVSQYVQSVDIQNGIITATGTQQVGNSVYRLQASITSGQILSWEIDSSSSCLTMRICN